MIISTLTELTLIGVADAGIPNRERIVIRPTEPVNMAQYGILTGYKEVGSELITPLADNFFWFGEVVIEPPSWIFVYTGKGQYKVSEIPENGQLAYSFHWGRQYTMFNLPTVVPTLFKIESILIGNRLLQENKTLLKK